MLAGLLCGIYSQALSHYCFMRRVLSALFPALTGTPLFKDLDTASSPAMPMSTPNLARTPDRHKQSPSRIPDLTLSDTFSLASRNDYR